MTRLTANADGNVGSALYLWLGGVEETENNVLILGKYEQQEIPFKLNSEWELILYQILLRMLHIQNLKFVVNGHMVTQERKHVFLINQRKNFGLL